MRYPKLRELREAIKALIKGPYTTKFPYQPHIPPETFRGKPEFSEEDCVGCAACAQVCPSGAITFEDEINDGKAAKRLLTIRWDMCIFCGQCQGNCLTEKGIILSQEFDLATTAKPQELRQEIEKDLVTCQACREVIAPYDQILWVAKKLGPLTFSNPSLMLFYLRNQRLSSEEPEAKQEEKEFLRADRIKILCPRCRREAVIRS